MDRKITFSWLIVRCTGLALALVAYHFLLRELMLHHGLRLGAVSYKLAPLYAYWRPHLKGWLVLPLLVLAGYGAWLRRTRVGTSLTESVAPAAFSGWLIAIAASVAMLDDGPRSLIGPLQRADLEYYGAVRQVRGAGRFLRDYPRLIATMPMHARVHPPGAVLFLWAVDKVSHAGPWGAVAGMILFSSLSVILVYCWANRLGGPGVARRAAAIYVLTPSVVLFTATSMDGPFAVLLIAAMWLFWESLETPTVPHCRAREASELNGRGHIARQFRWSRPLILGTLAGLAAGLAALMTYSVTVAVLFCALACCVWWWTEPSKQAATCLAALCACVAFVALHLVLWFTTGYDPIEMFRVAVANSNHIMAGTRHESLERYCHLVVANLVVFFIAAGLSSTVIWFPTAWEGLREIVYSQRGSPLAHENPDRPSGTWKEACTNPAKATSKFALTAILTLLIATSVPVYTLEVERVWMFLIPLVAIPVGWQLFDQERRTGRAHATFAAAALLATQTLLTEVLLATYW